MTRPADECKSSWASDQSAKRRPMADKNSLTADQLRELLSYDENTGDFAWRTRRHGGRAAAAAAGTANRGYINIVVNRRSYPAHRLAWLYCRGSWPKGQIDHINGRRSDNRLSNLRDVPQEINQQNRRAAQRNSKSGMLGVSPNGVGWRAVIKVGGVLKQLGTFTTAQAAHDAYLAAKRRFHPGCTI